jgi:UDP-hydrolysing UDP-N-acetyl-D-glucosamine 2-epimerase
MRRITVVTGARSDYGIYRPILRRIAADADFSLELIVTGMHLAPEYGLTVRQIEQDGYLIRDRIDCLLASDTPQAVSHAMGLAMLGFSQAYARSTPELLVLLGDRTEMLAAGVAALPFRIPTVHIHGGELTEGAIDDAARHCLSKLSHVHCVSTDDFGRRVIQLGEHPSRVHVTGAPGLDAVLETPLYSPAEFESTFGIPLDLSPLLVTFHPVTQEYERTAEYTSELFAALATFNGPILFTYPNSDTNGRVIITAIDEFVRSRSQTYAVKSLGSRGYFTTLRHARAMVGNSSSGIIEAASFELPVINIGSRQTGRPQPRNVIQSGHGREELTHVLKLALDPQFRNRLRGLRNPYGDGKAAERIVRVLREIDLHQITRKGFHDLPVSPAGRAAA